MPPPAPPPHHFNQFAPRRSISTVTGPNRREVNAFYQHNFPHKNDSSSNSETQEYPQRRPSIMTGQSNQSNHLTPSKDQMSYIDPMRFSPPNVTPPPAFHTNDDMMISNVPIPPPRNRVRFDDLPSHPNPNFSVPPRKCSLAPNFFSSQNSHHMYPDQYTPRTWQTNEYMQSNSHHMAHHNPYHTGHWIHPNGNQQQQQQQQQMIRKHSAGPMTNRNRVDIKLESSDNQYLHNHDIMDLTGGGVNGGNTTGGNNNKLPPIKTEMLSPNKMDIENTAVSPSFLNIPNLSKSEKPLQEQKPPHHNVPTRKASIMATKSQLRARRGHPSVGGLPYTPPPILAPMRNGSGLFCQIAKSVSQVAEAPDVPSCSSGILDEYKNSMLNGKKNSTDTDGPSRKNGGCVYSQQRTDPEFLNGLEALRKDSWKSISSNEDKDAKLLIAERKISENEEQLRRKESIMSDTYYDVVVDETTHEEGDEAAISTSDTPHINIGREYQARVRKWNDREVHQSELDAIEDRDDMVWSSEVIEDIDPEQVNAFERLSCSHACPLAGRNKELALHLLMENKGNIEAAVDDLLRCDTIDWDQYSNIFGHSYNDSVMWTPEEIDTFQDAIYRSEKDFRVVAKEFPSKGIRECVSFYYTWKTACPDDYRKLRNLRRKRQLLDMNLKAEENMGQPPIKKHSYGESNESDNESNATENSYIGNILNEYRDRAFTSPIMSSPRESPLVGMSPVSKDLFGIQKNYQPTMPRSHHPNPTQSTTNKKGAQPSADGFFHCRLCDKCFEKVKSLNAHMKSHAMKARAEQEAKAHDLAAQAAAQLTNVTHNPVQTSPLNAFTNGHLGITIPSTIGSLTPQQLTPQQLNSHLSQLTTLTSLSNQLSSQLNSPLTPQQQLQQFTQQQLMARAMQQNLFNAQSPNVTALNSITQPTHPLLQASLHTIH